MHARTGTTARQGAILRVTRPCLATTLGPTQDGRTRKQAPAAIPSGAFHLLALGKGTASDADAYARRWSMPDVEKRDITGHVGCAPRFNVPSPPPQLGCTSSPACLSFSTLHRYSWDIGFPRPWPSSRPSFYRLNIIIPHDVSRRWTIDPARGVGPTRLKDSRCCLKMSFSRRSSRQNSTDLRHPCAPRKADVMHDIACVSSLQVSPTALRALPECRPSYPKHHFTFAHMCVESV